uniref:Uncharacterized protein n=1 Tax=Cucumis sativus TaxID=3659 RepID=A0A0A0KDQ8_CUCSA
MVVDSTDDTLSCITYYVCNAIFTSIMLHAGDMNHYDIRKKCEGSLCYDFSNMEKFLNQQSVREALGVGDIEFVSCSPTVYKAMLAIQDGCMQCNDPVRRSSWLLLRSPSWLMVQKQACLKDMAPSVHDAGHMVPMDQPKAALEMLKRWTRGTLYEKSSDPQILVVDM